MIYKRFAGGADGNGMVRESASEQDEMKEGVRMRIANGCLITTSTLIDSLTRGTKTKTRQAHSERNQILVDSGGGWRHVARFRQRPACLETW